jgi:hypothetical protein
LLLGQQGLYLGVQVVLQAHTCTGTCTHTDTRIRTCIYIYTHTLSLSIVTTATTSTTLSEQLHGLEQLLRGKQTRRVVVSQSPSLSLSLALFLTQPPSLTLAVTLSLSLTLPLVFTHPRSQHRGCHGIQRGHMGCQQSGSVVHL